MGPASSSIPAVGALLALSAALAAACFVKAFGVDFLGRPRTPPARRRAEVDRFSLAAMFVLAALCLLAGVLPGACDRRAGAGESQALIGARMPAQMASAWLSIVPIAESRSSYNGLLIFLFIAVSALVHGDGDPSLRLARGAPRAGLGLRLSRPVAGDAIYRRAASPSRSAGCSARRVPRPREVTMPPPGDMRPRAHRGADPRPGLGSALCAGRARRSLRRRR